MFIAYTAVFAERINMDGFESIVGPTIEDLDEEEMMVLTGGNGEAQPCATPGTIVISITAVGISTQKTM